MKRNIRTNFFYLGIFGVFFVLILLSLSTSADPDTFLNIPNSAPELRGLIPNQSWMEGTNLTDAFDLDDYFEDAEDNLIYYFIYVENISILISPNNTVSFFPDTHFIGTRVVNFIASDRESNTTSNDVHLWVGIDTIAPKWSNPRIDKGRVYQNSFVVFSVNWEDNFRLKNYTFQLNQEGIWTSYHGELNGTSDVANHSIQISSPAGKIVQWRGCASDTSENFNCTEIYQFNVLAPPIIPPPTVRDDPLETPRERPLNETRFYDAVRDLFQPEGKSDFIFNVNSMTVSLKQGEIKTRVLEITNIGVDLLNFSLSIEGLEENVDLSEHSFEIFPGETKSITLDFSADLNASIGEYFGVLVVESFKEARIPLALIINDVDLDFEILVFILDEDKTIRPGKDIKANLEIKNLKDQIFTEAILEYSIKDFEGNIYNSEKENISFEYSLFLERKLEIPENTPIGPYIFYARVFNEEESAMNSAQFDVGTRFRFAAFLRVSMVFLFIVILSFIILFLMVRYKKQIDKGRALNLYVKLDEMRRLIKEDKFDEAANIYIGIKKIYGEKVSGDLLNNKTKLAEVIKNLTKKIDLSEIPLEKKEEEMKNEKENSEEGKKIVGAEKTVEVEKKKEVSKNKVEEKKDVVSKTILEKNKVSSSTKIQKEIKGGVKK